MKNLRLFALGTAAVLSLSLLSACGSKSPAPAPNTSTPDSVVDVPPVELPQVISSLALNKTEFTLKAAGASYKLTAEVSGIENPVILWSSSDESVATVSESGIVTAVAAGTATITAAVEGTELTVECKVTCQIKAEEPAPEVKPEQPAPEVKPEPEAPAPEVKPEPEVPAAPAKVDLEAFYATIFTDPDNAPALVSMDDEMLNAFYDGLNNIALNQKVAYMPMMTAVPCEIVMVECANAADVETVKAIFKARIASQVDNHFNYPMVIEAWETEATVAAHGNFVALFVISGMTDEVVANFNALF